MEEKASLYGRMARVMSEVGYIKKRGRNQIQNYDYVMAADIAGEMAQLLSKHGLAFAPVEQDWEWETRESSRGGALFVCKLKVKYNLMDVDTGQSILIPSFGEGMDSGDKAAYKAMTGALKYALIQTFLIAAGDDPEEETEEKEVKVEAATTKVAQPVRSERLSCPYCNQQAVIKSRPEFGGGYVCYKKFGGCGEKFADNDSRIRAGVDVRNQPEQATLLSTPTDSAGRRTNGDAGGEAENRNGIRERITEEQLRELEGWCVTFNVDQQAVLRQYRLRDSSVQTLADLTPEMFQHASKVFATKREKANRMN